MRSYRVALIVVALSLLTTVPHATAGTAAHFWSRQMGGTAIDAILDLQLDPSGNILVAGRFQNTVDFGGGPLVSAGGFDVFVAKYDPNGNHLWSQRFGSTSNDMGLGVAVDLSGNVIVAGSFVGTVNFGGIDLVSAGSTDIFLAKYNTAGGHVWSQKFGSTGADEAQGVDTDGNSIMVTGYFSLTVNFGGSALASAGGADMFLARYGSTGSHIWSQRFGSTGSDEGETIDVGPAGVILVAGQFQDTVNFGGSPIVEVGGSDIFLAKYNSSGVHQWSQGFGSTLFDFANEVVVDGAGNVVLAGGHTQSINFGGGSLPASGQDGYLARFNSSGAHQWSYSFGGASSDGCTAVAIDPAGAILFSGFYATNIDLGGGLYTTAGNSDMFLAKFDNAGVHQWSTRFGGTGGDTSTGLAVDAQSNIVFTGGFSDQVSFGGTTFTAAGSQDCVLARFGPESAEAELTSIVDVANDQGRQVAIRFVRSGNDNPLASHSIVQYEAFRRSDFLGGAAPAGASRVSSPELTPANWVFVSAIPAHGELDYIQIAATAADSTIADGQHFSAFFVRAATSDPYTFFDSEIDSGYSVDNLAPSAPSGLVYAAGALSWNESRAADFDYFSVYGSASSTFNTSAILIDYTVEHDMNVSSAPYPYYYVTATDFSGNEGKASRVQLATGVDGPAIFALAINAYPNPFNPSTTIRFDVPARGQVRVSIYDARGARVAMLVNEEYDAGSHTVRWTGHDDRGMPSGSGVYFARLESNGATETRKLVLLK